MVLPRPSAAGDLRARIDRLEGLPLRPETARAVLDAEPGHDDLPAPPPRRGPVRDLDPGWQVAAGRPGPEPSPLAIVAGQPWWGESGDEGLSALTRLWRHSSAAALAAGRLAREAELSPPDTRRLTTAGLLANLGAWAAAAVDPGWLVGWFATTTEGDRRAFERTTLGAEVGSIGRRLAGRWRLDPLVADAAWLCDQPRIDPGSAEGDPGLVRMLQSAWQVAGQTPWAPPGHGHGRAERSGLGQEPRVKLLVAEVQSRCASAFLPADRSAREERLSRENARLQIRLGSLNDRLATAEGLVGALAESNPHDSPETWLDRAARTWCALPGVSAARVVWSASEDSDGADGPSGRPPDLQWPLDGQGRTVATVRLWTGPGRSLSDGDLGPTLAAWGAWAATVAERSGSERRLDAVVEALRSAGDSEGPQLGRLKLDALAEFAAGAGHELNNPLAVVVGRAQLLLGQETDPQKARSLRAILNQAQRAHRILRDLMYVARPPQPRLRYCQPDEIWRQCLRDVSEEAAGRDVRVVADSLGHGRPAWTDPDGLRHLAEILLRNALEATPPGGVIRVATSGREVSLTWTVQDSGRGLSRAEGEHLFDPFFCGRQAGRGLGLGLPRASRFVKLLGGEIQWQSVPGQGATFTVRVPLSEPPAPADGSATPTPRVA